MSKPIISVVIPLYNKHDEVAIAVQSVVKQTFTPLEVIVIDDGSTDNSVQKVLEIGSQLVKLIKQQNAGVSAARNCGINAAQGNFIAFLDADDWWEKDFLAEIAALIDQFPNCGIYSTAFNIVSKNAVHAAHAPCERGVVDNYFKTALHKYICMPSCSAVPKTVLQEMGGFPVGMKLGEDQYLWAKIACKYNVCFSPMRLMNYSRASANRSNSIYTPEKTVFSLRDLYSHGENPYLDEYIARVDLGKALILSEKGLTEQAKDVEMFYKWTKHNRITLRKLMVLNRLPVCVRACALSLYNRLAWVIARRGL